MLTFKKLIISCALCTLPATASSVYVLFGNQNGQFGTANLATGAITQIGPNTPEFTFGLVPGPNGSLLTLGGSGMLDSINPATGVSTVIGPTGLADCSTPTATCGPMAANLIGELRGTLYATDLGNNLYKVNPVTGAASLVGPTGIPAVPAIPDSINPDGTKNAFDEILFGSNGKLYATFDAIKIQFSPFMVTPVIAPELYQIDTTTGLATPISATALTLGAVVQVNGGLYAFDNMNSEVLSLNVANGSTTFVSNFDPNAGIIAGGTAPTPEPASVALVGLGGAAVILFRRKKSRWTVTVSTIAIACSLGIRANADTLAITYNFAGGLTGPPVQTGTTLTLNGLETGSLLSGNPSLNAIWNPVTYNDHSEVELTTGLLNGTFSMEFADGNALSGNVFEDTSKLDAMGVGPFTQTLTFTGGTGQFAGATGSFSGAGVGNTDGFMSSGSGTINAPAIPEPASASLLLGGLALTLGALRRSKGKSSSV